LPKRYRGRDFSFCPRGEGSCRRLMISYNKDLPVTRYLTVWCAQTKGAIPITIRWWSTDSDCPSEHSSDIQTNDSPSKHLESVSIGRIRVRGRRWALWPAIWGRKIESKPYIPGNLVIGFPTGKAVGMTTKRQVWLDQ
jgi:hypothetical protein